MKKTTRLAFMALVLFATSAMAQQKSPTEYGGGLKVNLSEDGQKYFRLILWSQVWLDMKNQKTLAGEDKFTATPMLRRSRFLMYAQLTDRFLILTHFGLNNLTPAGLDPTGQSSQAQLFLHDAWTEFKVNEHLYFGGGLHYWNGISRLNNQSTLNMLGLDNPRHAWATIGTTDQFARHLGIYAKGNFGKFDYRLAWNGAMVNSLDANNALLAPTTEKAVYTGRKALGVEAANIFAGYLNYQFWDQESNKLPYFVGTYLGKKKVLSIGAGFYSHPKGAVIAKPTADDPTAIEGENVLIWAADAFMELPIGENNAAFCGYLQFQANDYGSNYQLSGTSQEVFTGNVIYFQGGYLLPNHDKVAWQPYVTVTQKSITALDGSATDFGIGINSLLTGHNAKLSLEYHSMGMVNADAVNRVILQAVVFL